MKQVCGIAVKTAYAFDIYHLKQVLRLVHFVTFWFRDFRFRTNYIVGLRLIIYKFYKNVTGHICLAFIILIILTKFSFYLKM